MKKETLQTKIEFIKNFIKYANDLLQKGYRIETSDDCFNIECFGWDNEDNDFYYKHIKESETYYNIYDYEEILYSYNINSMKEYLFDNFNIIPPSNVLKFYFYDNNSVYIKEV